MALASDEKDSDVIEDTQQKSEIKDSQSKDKYMFKEMPKAICKTEQDSVSLPDPFELLKHYRPNVEVALKSGKMTIDTTKAILSTVAAAMFAYKIYPTADDYSNVARVVIHHYPFMKSPTGKPVCSDIYMYMCSDRCTTIFNWVSQMQAAWDSHLYNYMCACTLVVMHIHP